MLTYEDSILLAIKETRVAELTFPAEIPYAQEDIFSFKFFRITD
ncbi:MAG: hypothetical protein WCP96_17695 [Methylococcaceae bacterium]